MVKAIKISDVNELFMVKYGEAYIFRYTEKTRHQLFSILMRFAYDSTLAITLDDTFKLGKLIAAQSCRRKG